MIGKCKLRSLHMDIWFIYFGDLTTMYRENYGNTGFEFSSGGYKIRKIFA